jgi:predicted ATPase/DNA-binding CsgD family transcriptional regulator
VRSPASAPLSTRQAEIASLVARAKSNSEIARLLNLSERTVEAHVAAIFNKLGVHSRVELATALVRSENVRDGDPDPDRAARSNLPRNRPELVGRDGEIAELAGMLESGRLVTVTGAGGVGKTQTALAVGERLESARRDVWLVELAPLAPGSSVAGAICTAVGAAASPDRPVLDTLRAHFGNRASLVILDNCEHVIDEAAAVVVALSAGCPNLRIIATSREPLRVAGERRFRLPSLPVPDAVALFVRRAAASDGRFAVSDANESLVADICRRLDGIPLAIELAAARASVLSLRGLAAKLDDRFRILTGGDRTALPRHRTMRALFDWSYDLLSAPERRLFERLSIFAGGAGLELIAAVAPEDPTDEAEIVELLASLVEKSLLTVDVSAYEPRYALLESSRQYAQEKLASRGDASATARRHARACAELAEELGRLHDVASESEWLARVEPELENFHAALNWTLAARGDIELGQRLASAMRPMWNHFSVLEGRRRLEAARSFVTAYTPPALAARLDCAAANIAFACNEFETALALSRQASATLDAGGDEVERVRATYLAGAALLCLGRSAEAEPLLHEALAAGRALRNLRLVGTALQAIAYACSSDGDGAAARAHFGEALEIWRAIGAKRDAAIARVNLAEAEFVAGNVTAAVDLVTAAIATLRETGFTRALLPARLNLAAYLIACDRWEEARTTAREALAIAQETQRNVFVACALQRVAAITVLAPDARGPSALEDAARILGYVDTCIAALGSPRHYTEQQEYDRARAAIDAALGPVERDRLMLGGAAMSQEQALRYARAD